MIEKILIFSAFIVCGYLLGNISFARIISKGMKNDITKLGSGNPGTMNVARNFGFGMGLLNLILDVLKSVIPCLCAYFVAKTYFANLTNILVYSTGLAVLIGNMFPVFYKFKGGKGVAVTLGMFAVLYPLWFAGFLLLGFVMIFTIKIGSLTSLTLILGLSIVGIVFNTSYVEIILICIIFALILIAHRQNLVRLFSGKESKVDLLKKKNKKVDGSSTQSQTNVENKTENEAENVEEKQQDNLND